MQVSECLEEEGLGWLLDFEHAPTQSQKRKRREAPEEALNHIASPSKMETPVSERRDLKHPLPEHLRHIFHLRMCERIAQRKGGAAVTIRYAADLTKCHLKITILRESIPNLAIRLFGCTLEDTPTGWVLQVEQGPDVKSGRNGYFGISRASVAAVGLFIGTPIRELVDRGDEMTTLLSLYVWGTPKSNGVIVVEAPADKLETIASKLWPPLQ
ncbi:hypothetical protein MAJ_10166, partial [Metarhizium majus ARSEF 297]